MSGENQRLSPKTSRRRGTSRYAKCLWALGFVALIYSGDTASADEKAYLGSSFEADFLPVPKPKAWIEFIAENRVVGINSDGTVSNNVNWPTGPLYVEAQRLGFHIVRGGISANDTVLMDKGLSAIEWAFRDEVLGPQFNWPSQREFDEIIGHALHPRSVFLEFAARTVLLIRQSKAPADIKARAEALVPKMVKVAQGFVSTGDAARFFKKVPNSSQLAFVAVSIALVGDLAGDHALQNEAELLMRRVIKMQREDGAFFEKHGHDTSYQLNTLELTVTYESTLSVGSDWRRKVRNANRRGITWFFSRVSPDGSVDTSGNTRTVACGEPILGDFPKGLDIDTIPIRLYYYAFLHGNIGPLKSTIDTIQYHGQGFAHDDHC